MRDILAMMERKLEESLAIDCKPGWPVDIPVSVASIDRAEKVLGGDLRSGSKLVL